MKHGLVAVLGVLLVSGCGSAPPSATAAGSAPATTTPTSSRDTVAAYFSPPQPYPGPAWTRGGRSVDPEELDTIAGPGHCDWQTVTFLLGWPVGTMSRTAAEMRQFVRDPGGVLPRPASRVTTGIDLPHDARDTGYRHGDLQLWLSRSDPDGAHLRVNTNVERWPRANPVIVCS